MKLWRSQDKNFSHTIGKIGSLDGLKSLNLGLEEVGIHVSVVHAPFARDESLDAFGLSALDELQLVLQTGRS